MSALSNRPVVWAGFVAAVVAAVVAAYATNSFRGKPADAPTAAPATSSSAQPSAPHAAAPAPGELPVATMRKTDPGQEYYRQGRYDLAMAYWTKAAEAGD